MPKYSFLIPVYNVEKYIERCIESLLCQTYLDYEIIVIDDCSTDKSWEKCKELERKNKERIHVCREKKKVGLYQVRFDLLERAKGDYIVFVDGDDYIDVNLLKDVDNYISKNRCDVIIYDFYAEYRYRFGIKKLRLHQIGIESGIYKENDKDKIYQEFTTGRINTIWRKVFHKSLLRKDDMVYGLNKRALGEDALLTMPILMRAERIGYLNKPLYYYQRNVRSLSRSSDIEDRIECMITVAQEMQKYINLWGIEDRTKLYCYYIEQFADRIRNIFLLEENERIEYLCMELSGCTFYQDVLDRCQTQSLNGRLMKLCVNKNYKQIKKLLRGYRLKMKLKDIVERLIFQSL